MTVRYMTVKEYADWKRVTVRSIRAMIKRGELKAEKIGREYRIPVEDD